MQLWKNFINRLSVRHTDKLLKSGSFQEELDTFKVFLATTYYEKMVRTGLAETNPDDAPEGLSSTIYRLQKAAIYGSLDKQVQEMFTYVKEMGGMDPYPVPLREVAQGPHKRLLDTLSGHKEKEDKRRDTDIVEKEIVHWTRKFSLIIRKSSIDHPEAGLGVFVKGVIQPGTLLGIYPGTVLFPTSMNKADAKDNNYMIGRYDGVIVNGKDWEAKAARVRQQQEHYTTAGLVVNEDKAVIGRFRNPFGIIQYVNHPSADSQPNVICYSYDFTHSMLDEESKQYVPNEYPKAPTLVWATDEDIFMRSILCVATTRIRDEELFLNYRFNPALPYPGWYTQPDIEEAKRRWGKRRLLPFSYLNK